MLDRLWVRMALVGALLVAAVVGPSPEGNVWWKVGAVVFGAFNALVTPPGTQWARLLSIVATLAALIAGGGPLLLVIGWLLWPPAYMASWSIARGAEAPPAPRNGDDVFTQARISVAGLIIALTIASIVYRVLFMRGLQQTAALFVGIPALLAVLVVFAVSPRSAAGVACKAVTIGLLVSILFLGEGVLCVVMSAPLFYAVGIGIGAMIGAASDTQQPRHSLRSYLILLPFIPMTLEGVTDLTTFNRDETVVRSKVVAASPDAVARALQSTPRFDRLRPMYLRAGFPSPVSTSIDRSGDTPRWVIQLRGGETRLDGMEARTGDLILELADSRPGVVRWRATADTSHMTHFLNWQEATVQWEPAGAGTTRVTWTLRYRRGLDPAWYFGPWERFAVGLAADYLIDSVATP
jgi:Polyketide cyclase / dehydrase and lipid transport